MVLALVAVLVLLSLQSQRSDAVKITAATRAQLQPPAPASLGSAKEPSFTLEKSSTSSDAASNALALSSFLSNSAVGGLDPDTCVRLEVYLQEVRRVTYQLLVESGTVARLPDGRIHVEIAGESGRANELKDQVHSSIESIVGKEAMKQMKESLGPGFEAKFAYFGQYDTTIDLSIARTPNSNEYITMASAYKQVKLLGLAKANIRSTSVERKDRFERQYFSLSALKPSPNGG